jgi:hypothetical protein
VNQLPWELYQSTKETHAVLVMCAEQLHAGVVPNEHFPFLTKDNDDGQSTLGLSFKQESFVVFLWIWLPLTRHGAQ